MAVFALILVMIWLGTASAYAADPPPPNAYRVTDYGAVGDGEAKDTSAVQRAIDACSAAGGGTVHLASGAYLCGSLHLRSHVTLWLDAGATILGSPDKDDYDPYETVDFENDADGETSYFHYALVWGEDVGRVAILGQGTIDGNRTRRGGPKPIALKRCRLVDIKGITILNAPNYCISLLGADYVNIDGVTILNGYCDGIDPDSCRNVRIANCHIEAWDDAIVPKTSFSLGERRSVENLTVTNCYLATGCNAFKLGTESGGDFKRIAVSNCVMGRLDGAIRPARSGIALESVDGAHIDGVVISNITMHDVRAPIFLRLGNRGRDMDTPVPGSLKNVAISNVVATDASLTSSITGIPGHPVEGVTLSNIRIMYRGGGPRRADDDPVPEALAKYPDPNMFYALPAYGLYCRHVRDLTLDNVSLSVADDYWRFTYTEEDDDRTWPEGLGMPSPAALGSAGHAVVCDDVADLRISNLQARPAPEGDALLRFISVRDALIRGCSVLQGQNPFLEVAGADTGGIALVGNDFRRGGEPCVFKGDAPEQSLRMESNMTE